MDKAHITFIVLCVVWMFSLTYFIGLYVRERTNVEHLSDAIRNAKDNGDKMIFPLVQQYGFDTLSLGEYSYCY